MSNKMKARVKNRLRGIHDRSAKLARDIHKADDVHLHNRQGGGALPLPSTLGWGQHKSKKTRISLFNPFKEP